MTRKQGLVHLILPFLIIWLFQGSGRIYLDAAEQTWTHHFGLNEVKAEDATHEDGAIQGGPLSLIAEIIAEDQEEGILLLEEFCTKAKMVVHEAELRRENQQEWFRKFEAVMKKECRG